MGIYDREYYRREGPSILDSFTLRGQVCKWLIILNVLVFVLQLLTRKQIGEWPFVAFAPGPLTEALILDTQAVMHGQVWRLLTYAFLHDTTVWQHIVFNMLFLWWFGGDLEELYGWKEFLTFYLVSAVIGGMAFEATALMSGRPMYCLGASGAVTAVLVLFAFHYPTRLVYLFFVLPVPVWVLVVFQVGQDAFYFVGGIRTQTAVAVHLGGAAFAFLYFQGQRRLTNLWPSLRLWQQRRSRPRLRVYREEEEQETPQPQAVAVAAPPAREGDVDEQLEAKLDAVLEKVSRLGQASLTDNERQILMRASEIYKRKRT
jgi:membrane associated rhomboid family serine protease